MYKPVMKRRGLGWGVALGLLCWALILGAVVGHAQTLAPASFRNILIGGDASTNPYQRGTASVTGITSTATYGPDRWFGFGGGGSSITLARTATSATLAGFSQAMQLQRAAANADTTKICLAQIVESAVATQYQGQPMTLSWYAAAGANLSAASSQMEATVVTGTGADQAAANLIAGTWTGQATAADALKTLTTGFQRYSLTFTPASAETQIAVELCFTPVGTAGTTDAILITGVQLEGGSAATPFELRSPGIELALAQRYFYQITESTGITPRGVGHITTAGAGDGAGRLQVAIQFPVTMRIAPTASYTAGFAGFTTTAETTRTNCSALVIDPTVTFVNSKQFALAQCSLTSSTIAVGLSMSLSDNSGSGVMAFSAEY